jgi:phosphoserine phosphatase
MPIKVVFFDCDGTLTKTKSSWEYLHRRLNLWTKNADAYQALFREGKIDYNEFCRRDAFLWRGLPVSMVYQLISEIPYQENAARVVGTLKKSRIFTVIISSGLSLLVDRVKGDLSVDMAFSNELVSRAGLLTGDIKINVGYNQKGPLVRKVLELLGLQREEASAVGDGDGDKGMFDEVALPIGFAADGFSPGCPGHTNQVLRLDGVVELIREYP